MRQIGAGLYMYTQDNKGYLPQPAVVANIPSLKYVDEDWIYWQSDRDITQSRIWKYIGSNAKVLHCPSGREPKPGAYPFSYSLNINITGRISGRYSTYPSGTIIVWGLLPVKLTKVVHPSQKLMLIEENSVMIDDGGWTPSASEKMSVRHDGASDGSNRATAETRWMDYRRGNVVFADGHYEFVVRYYGWMQPWTDPLYK